MASDMSSRHVNCAKSNHCDRDHLLLFIYKLLLSFGKIMLKVTIMSVWDRYHNIETCFIKKYLYLLLLFLRKTYIKKQLLLIFEKVI